MKKFIYLLLTCLLLTMSVASHAGEYTGTVVATQSPLSAGHNLVTLSDGVTYIYFGPTEPNYKSSSVMPALFNDLLIHQKTATFDYNDLGVIVSLRIHQ
jgi:hypothetical protein